MDLKCLTASEVRVTIQVVIILRAVTGNCVVSEFFNVTDAILCLHGVTQPSGQRQILQNVAEQETTGAGWLPACLVSLKPLITHTRSFKDNQSINRVHSIRSL